MAKKGFETKTALMLVLLPIALFACDAGPANGEPATTPSDLASAPIDTGADDDTAAGGETAPTAAPSAPGAEPTAPGAEPGTGAAPSEAPSGEEPPTATPAPIIPTRAMPFRGINLAGAEFGGTIPGTEGSTYKFPTPAEIDYFASKGMNTFRIAFLWERLQPTAYGALAATYTSRLDAIVAYATSKGTFVILEPHNFARYYGNVVGTTAVPNGVMADLWKRLAARYAGNARVMFNLMNEPRDMPTEQWVSAANASIAAIRQAGATQAVVVPGNGWTGAHSWSSSWYGTSNAVAMLNVTDPGNNMVYEVHQYLDADSGGSSTTCSSVTAGVDRMKNFVDWLRKNGKKGFLGEFAGGNNTTCHTAVKNMLDYLMASSDVLVGWLWWAAGPAWGEYIFTLEPKSGVDRPQMAWLAPYLK